MKGSSFDTPGFRRYLENTLSGAVTAYFAKEKAEAVQRKKSILSNRSRSYTYNNFTTGWTEEYAIVVEHYQTYGGGHGVRVGVRDADRTFTIVPVNGRASASVPSRIDSGRYNGRSASGRKDLMC